MTNSKIYLIEVQKISERWEKRYDQVVTRSLVFLQINAALLTLLFLIGIDDNSWNLQLLKHPILVILLSSLFSIITFFPLKIPEINIRDINYENIDVDAEKIIYDSLIYEYLQKIKSLKRVYLAKLIFFTISIISLLVAMIRISTLFF